MADGLPLEVLVKIFSYVPRHDLARKVQFVCQRWQLASWDRSLWTSFRLTPCGDAKKTIDSLALFSGLRNLDLVSVYVNNDLVRYLTDSCPNLERLHICWDSIYNYAEVTINRPLLQIKTLYLYTEQELYMDFPYLHRTFPNLEQLEISVLRFNKNDFVQFLKTKRSSLHILSVPCRTEDGHCVLPCLSECKNLKKLSLRELCEDVEDLAPKEVEHLTNISSICISDSNVNRGRGNLSVFKHFPNISELELYGCSQSNADTLRIVANNCPRLWKLDLSYNCSWHGENAVGTDTTLKSAHCLKSLTHLSIHVNMFVTDQCVQYLQLIPKLTHLDLYQCELLTNASLNVICGFDKLQVLKFDLKRQNTPRSFIGGLVKNRNIQLLLCQHRRDLYWLDILRQERFWVDITEKLPGWH